MATKVTIEDLKSIAHLQFEVPGPGAYLLTGSNGSGKTSLLTCLSRLGNSGAFQKGFRSSSHPALDSHEAAKITYDFDGSEVTYTYVGERWNPRPKRNSDLLARSGFHEVRYIAADADRVEPQKQEFAPNRVRLTDQSLRDALNRIFDTSRFSELCYINLHRGGRVKAYLVRQTRQGRPTTYFSERNFSLGELCVLKLLLNLRDVAEHSLILIDELELALHPRAQARLFEFLTQFATEKTLTIIFSTHSVSLIKNTDRRQVLFLSDSNGSITCRPGVYPAFALGQITAGEEVAPDCVIYVEDDSAKKCVDAMVALYKRTINPEVATPTVVPVALGGFKEILNFLDRSPLMLPRTTRVQCLLDQDVQTESILDYQQRQDHEMLALFERLADQVKYLPWTPEVGLLQLINSDRHRHEQGLRTYFSDPRFSIPADWPPAIEAANPTPGQFRKHAKTAVYRLTENLVQLTGRPKDRVREGLFDYLVHQAHAGGTELVQLISRVIHP